MSRLKKHFPPIFIAGLFLLTYVPTLVWMWDRWFARDSYYSHGILIPFVTAYLIWQKRDELARISHRRSRWGIPLVVIGLGLHVISSLFRVYFSSGFSMIVVLIGLILYFYGWKFLQKNLFPVFFLVFMVPIPLVIIANISFKMKILAAQIATFLLNRMGFLAIRDGSWIRMQHAYVIVDDVCSGLRSLISLTALGSIFAYWMKGPMIKRMILFLSTIPIAIITNVFRIIFLSFISEVWGPQYATGLTHDISGFLVFALAFALLFAVGRILE
ncbi:MAG: exosortase/archaeosortase family protein [Candidatus Omnitrophota bacterium]